MPQFNKRGNRIRASDKSLVFRFSAGSLLLLFLAVVMLLNLKTIITTDWKVISLFQDGSVHLTVTPYRIMTIVLAALVCVLATLFYRRFQYDRVKHHLFSKTVLPYGAWTFIYPYGNYIREISRPAFTLGKEAGNRLIL